MRTNFQLDLIRTGDSATIQTLCRRPGRGAENHTLRNSAGLKAVQGESKVISGSLWEHEK